MDEALRGEITRLCAEHGIRAGGRKAIERLVEALTDTRLGATVAPTGVLEAPLAEEPYEDLGPIGAGGMGEVRRVRERALGRVVAMKVLRRDGSEGWFAREARLTASLDHPGVPPIFAWGRRADGRPFFTQREVHGRTLRELLDDPGAAHDPGETAIPSGLSPARDHKTPDSPVAFATPRAALPQRRALEALRRVAETVASAHAAGIVHRDLKPENVVLGRFGEVWVLDWGIAGPTGEVQGPGIGSPRYLSPEQARGGPIGPTTDVWALGALLHELLAGRPPGPRRRPVAGATPELQRLIDRCLSPDPADRPADAEAFAEALGAFLDGARAREEAEITLGEAELLLRVVAQRREDAARLRQEAAATLAIVPRWAPPEEKMAAWEQEDRARREEREADVEEARAAELARAALERCPDLDAAHVLLADHYRRRLDDAERSGDPAAARLEAQLRAHDRGRYSAWLAGDGAVTIVTDPPGARVVARPYVEHARRLVPGTPRELGTTPLHGVPLPRGSWLLTLEAEGCEPVRYPVFLRRGEHWDGVPPGEAMPRPVRLPRVGELGPDEIFVPCGWALLGSDVRVSLSHPPSRQWVDGFVIERFATTNARWLAYLHALQQRNPAAAFAAVPRERAGRPGDVGVPLYGFEDGRWFLKADGDGDLWEPDWPVLMIDYAQACAYATWRASETGRPWQLLSGVEWEKAARGTDARVHPWGNGYDPVFACCASGRVGKPLPVGVDGYPIDESPYGVRGMGGLSRTWTRTLEPDGRVEARGSYWNASGEATGRAAARFLYNVGQRNIDLGVRLGRSFV